MDTKQVFAVLAFVISVLAYFPYVRAILKSGNRPTLSTWISWGVVDVAIFAGMWAQNEIAWQMAAYIVGVTFVLTASLYKGAVMGWTTLDTRCVLTSIIAMILWAITGNPNLAIALSLIAVTVGSIPMWQNIWNDPTRESLPAWLLYFAGAVCGVIAIPKFTVAYAATPIVFAILTALTILLMCRRFRQL